MADEARAIAHEAREQSSEHLQVILDHIKDVVLTVDEEGVISTFNPTGERVFGFDEAEVVGQRIDLLLPKIATDETIPEALERLAASPGDTALDLAARELWARRKNGGMFPAEIAVSKAPLSRREMFVLCLRDVTERRESEQAMRESAARYRLLVDHAPEAIVVLDVDTGRFVDANDKAEKLFGLERARLLKCGPIRLSPPQQPDGAASAQRARAYIQRALEGEVQVFEWAHCDAAGREIICEVRLVSLPSGNRRLVRGSIADISERKRGERMAAAERKVFEQVSRNAPLPEVLASITRLIESACAGTLSSVSVLAEDRQAFSYMVAPLFSDGLRLALERACVGIRNGSCAAAVYLDRQVLVADVGKDPFWLERREAALGAGLRAAWSTPIKAAGGHVLGSLGVYRAEPGLPTAAESQVMARAAQLAGIAIERRLAEEALRESEAKFRGLFESIAEGVYQSGRDGRLLSVNPAFVAMLGYGSAEEVYALPSAAALYWNPADRAEFARRVESEGEIRDAEFLMRRRDGQQLVILENARPMRDGSGPPSSATRARSPTSPSASAPSRRSSPRRSARRSRSQSIGDAVISTDAEGRIEYINPVAESLTAWSLAEARGQPIGAVLNLVNELTREPIENSLNVRARRAPARGAPADHSVLVTRAGARGRDPGIRRTDLRPPGARHRRGGGVPRRHQGAAPEARALLAGEPRCAHRPHQPPRVRQPPARGAAVGAARRGLVRAAVHRPRPVQGRRTTPAATRPAIACCAMSRGCCRRGCAPRTPSPAWAAMSSACCWRAARSSRRPASPRACARRSATSASCGARARCRSARASASCRSAPRPRTSPTS